MNRMQQFDLEVKEITKKHNRMRSTQPFLIDAEFCINPFDGIASRFDRVSIYKGMTVDWIASNGFIICKRKDASALLIVGVKCDGGAWIGSKTKNYWLRPAI